MSLDLSIAPNSCKHCGRGDGALEFNYTYMECLHYYGGSRKHRYQPYKTLFLRKTKYQCIMCHNKLNEWEYKNWQDMWVERDRLIKHYMDTKL